MAAVNPAPIMAFMAKDIANIFPAATPKPPPFWYNKSKIISAT
jgi:hypothetical protein